MAEQASGVDFRFHVGNHCLNHLKVGEGLAELLPCCGIVNRHIQTGLCDAKCLSSNADTPAIQSRQGNFKTLIFCAEDVGFWHTAILEDQLRCV